MKLYLLLLLPLFSLGQPRTNLRGKVTADLSDLAGILVHNLAADQSTFTRDGGYFDIAAKAGDTIMFSAVQFRGKRLAVPAEAFGIPVWFVRLEAMINQLDEVEIKRYNSINAEALGISPGGMKSYTPAERKLRTASGMGGIGPVGTLDPLINWITGRTAMLKKEVDVERKEMLKKKLEDIFEPDYFTGRLKIPQAYVEDFLFYISADKPLEAAVKAKNKTMTAFLVSELAESYKKLLPSGG